MEKSPKQKQAIYLAKTFKTAEREAKFFNDSWVDQHLLGVPTGRWADKEFEKDRG